MNNETQKTCEERSLPVVAFAGNPNVGKSSVFNILSGMHQHTGNWSGKTVGNAIGKIAYNSKEILLSDLPGAYSLQPESFEEEVARNFLMFCKPELVVYVCGATSLERNLIMLMQICEFCENVILCVNMTDELEICGASFDKEFTQSALGIKTICVSAKKKKGIEELKKEIYEMLSSTSNSSRKLLYDERIEEKISEIENKIKDFNIDISNRGIAVRVLLRDKSFITVLSEIYSEYSDKILEIYDEYESFDFSSKINEMQIKRAEQITSESLIYSDCCENNYLKFQKNQIKFLPENYLHFP